MQTPLHRPHDQQTRRTEPINEVLSTDARQENVCVSGQLSGTRNRLTQNFHYLFVRQFVMGWRE